MIWHNLRSDRLRARIFETFRVVRSGQVAFGCKQLHKLNQNEKSEVILL